MNTYDPTQSSLTFVCSCTATLELPRTGTLPARGAEEEHWNTTLWLSEEGQSLKVTFQGHTSSALRTQGTYPSMAAFLLREEGLLHSLQ